MPITLELRENNRVLYSEFTDPYTLSDAARAQEKELELRNSAGGIIHAVVNLINSGKPPSGAIRVAKESPSLIHPTHGQLIVYGASFFSTTIVQLASRLATKRFENIRFFRTEDEAWKYVRDLIAQEDKQRKNQSGLNQTVLDRQ